MFRAERPLGRTINPVKKVPPQAAKFTLRGKGCKSSMRHFWTGSAIVGNVGSENRMDYTVIGDSVNVAARLEQIAKGGEIIIGEQTFHQTQDLSRIQEVGQINLKNKTELVICYKVIG